MFGRNTHKQLLDATINEKFDYFDKKALSHNKLSRTLNDVKNSILVNKSDSIVLIIGPTGVGKTTLRQRYQQALVDKFDPVQFPGRIPFGSLQLPSPDDGKYNWRDTYMRSLLLMDDPLPHKKQAPRYEENYSGNGSPIRRNYKSKSDWQLAWENCLVYRKPEVFIFDEAQHLLKVGSGKQLLNQIDHIKSISDSTDVPMILIGTYELLDLIELSAQIIRRTSDFYFHRYRADNELDQAEFLNVLFSFQQYMPVHNTPNLVGLYELLYERSAGCIGILKSWLNRALFIALNNNETSLSQKIIEGTALRKSKVKKIAMELLEGESRCEESDDIDLKIMLKMRTSEFFAENPISATVKDSNKNYKSTPFKRNPHRDPVNA